MKKTVIIGASPDPSRYAYTAAHMLQSAGILFVPVGIKKGEVAGVTILNEKIPISNVHTVTLYVGPQHQAAWEDYIFQLKPSRVIFNPGTESDLIEKVQQAGIEAEVACTLVLLSTGQY